jgi:hypothetical protein
MGTAALQGTVYELDGQTLDRSGVSVTVLETGATYLTDPDGEFRFDELAPGTYTLDFDTVLTMAAMLDEEAESEKEPYDRPHDEAVEDEEGRPKVDVPEGGGEIDVRVKIEDGEVTDFSVGHHEERHAIGWLEPVADGLHVEGKIRLSAEGDVYELAVCVWGLEHGDAVTIWIGDDLVADPVANAEGYACFERRLEHVANLYGRTVYVRLGDELLLEGAMPDLPAEKPPPEEKGEGEGAAEEKEHDGEATDETKDHEEATGEGEPK